MNLKKELRNYYLDLRKAIDIDEATLSILPLFREWLQIVSYKTIGSYKAMQHLNELNVAFFEKVFISQNPNTIIAYPTVEEDKMHFYTENETSFIQKNKWNIDEIQNGTLLHPIEFDLIICPLLICDENGYRLGYGKGFYDRYLSQVRPDCLKIGFGCFEPIKHIPEIHQWDIPLDIYFTPNSVYIFSNS